MDSLSQKSSKAFEMKLFLSLCSYINLFIEVSIPIRFVIVYRYHLLSQAFNYILTPICYIEKWSLSFVLDGKQLLAASAERSLTRAFLREHLLDATKCPLSHNGTSLSDEGAQQVPNSVTDHVSGPLLRKGDGIHNDFNSTPNSILRRSKTDQHRRFPDRR